MKPMNLKLLYFFMISFFLLMLGCDELVKEIEKQEKTKVSFEEMGYFKSNNLRYKTFFLTSKSISHKDSIPEGVILKIREHGSKQTNTSGNITASFYYLDRNKTPDISNLQNAEVANNMAHDNKPVIAVWIMPNGNINLLKNPE